MRRSRTALTAWPAFADLMTVLAVLGLATAAGVAVAGGRGKDIPALKAKLAAAQQRNDSLKAELEAARQRNANFKARIEELEARIKKLEMKVAERVLGSVPCLGTRRGSPTTPVPLLQIVVDSGYRLTRLWPGGAEVEDIPQLDAAIAHGLMQEVDLRSYAGGMYEYGRDRDTYDGDCRFWVELRKGETTSLTTFAPALGLVNEYFLISNSSEVNRILRQAE